jgi:hypothetical protein
MTYILSSMHSRPTRIDRVTIQVAHSWEIFDLNQSARKRPNNHRTGNSFDEIASPHRLPQGSGPRQLRRRLQQGFATGEMGFRGQFARQQSRAAHVRFGSLAAAPADGGHVRFTPESCRGCRRPARQLRAKSGQRAAQQFDAVPTAVDADQEADLIIRRRQYIADDLASEVLIASHKRAREHSATRSLPAVRSGSTRCGRPCGPADRWNARLL